MLPSGPPSFKFQESTPVKPGRFLVVCGGTGGHLSPGIAIAQELMHRGHTCELVISQKEVDSRLIAKYQTIPYHRCPGVGFSFSSEGILAFLKGQKEAFCFVRELLESKVFNGLIAFGGFLTPPSAFAAHRIGLPVILHESNRVTGRSIQLLTPLADRVYLPVGTPVHGSKKSRVRFTGFPIRREIQIVDEAAARKSMGMPAKGPILLVLGGSQGATVLNQWAEQAFDTLSAHGVSVLCVTGQGKETYTSREVSGCVLRFVSFMDDMASFLSCGDLIVARSGAGSLAEIIRCRCPAILVPYPHATDRHQHANAEYLERHGAVLVVEQSRIETLAGIVIKTIKAYHELEAMKKMYATLDADNRNMIVNDLLELTRQPENSVTA